MTHAVPEGRHRLAREHAARSIGHRAADHDRQALAGLRKRFVNGKQRGLGVERIEDRFDQQHVGSACDQAKGLLQIGRAQLFKGDVARTGVVHVGADASRLGGGAKRAGHEAGLVGRGELVAGRTREAGAFQVHFVGQIGHAVIVLRNRGGAECVGFDDVSTRRQIAFVDLADDVGARQAQQFVVALDVVREVLETGPSRRIRAALAAVLFLGQFEALHHGAHGAVKDGDALAQNDGQSPGTGVGDGWFGHSLALYALHGGGQSGNPLAHLAQDTPSQGLPGVGPRLSGRSEKGRGPCGQGYVMREYPEQYLTHFWFWLQAQGNPCCIPGSNTMSWQFFKRSSHA